MALDGNADADTPLKVKIIDQPFDDPEPPPKEPPETEEIDPRRIEIYDSSFRWAEALNYWRIANEESAAKRYGNAEVAYEESQRAVVRYFEKFYTTSPLGLTFKFVAGTPVSEKVAAVVAVLFDAKDRLPELWGKIRRRREAITLEELQRPDWGEFTEAAEALLTSPFDGDSMAALAIRQQSLDYFALILATVFIPLARAEMNRIRRYLDAAIDEYERLLKPYRAPSSEAPIWLTCDFIERPFILLALGETRMEKAEVQFKAASQGKADAAQKTYQSILTLFRDHGTYVKGMTKAQETLAGQANLPLTTDPDQQDIRQGLSLQVLGYDVTVPGIKSNTVELPGLSQTKAPAESWLQIAGGEGFAETNPRIYALLLGAQARLLQIDKGFNYLGYKDDYIPPWRFQFLLERARYFTEHAKNAQRDYLNFLTNAEREEFQEQGAAQTVELEKANVGIETARVNQVFAELSAARESWTLAQRTATNSGRRLQNYSSLSQTLAKLERESRRISLFKSLAGYAVGAVVGAKTGNPGLAVSSGLDVVFGDQQGNIDKRTASAQRGYEQTNLAFAQSEAAGAANVAKKQYEVAQAGLIVSCLQRQASLLRHEFALQNLQYLRNRTLNAEQWFRLANGIRGVADTYLRYAIELAFLAEQSYEFEADKRINVIRFDYDQSEVGAYLAADFLLRDLDTIEQDFIVNQRQRQQQVRYTLSLAREFPAALEDLRKDKKVDFLLRLEQIEKRFPGLYNVRVGMVDVLPVALMDSTRFSLDLTHTGSSQLRIRGQPDVRLGEQSTSVFNVTDLSQGEYDWTKTPQELWPVKILVNEPETAVFSGLLRQDAASAFPVASSGQRNAFEGRGLAGGWQIDMSARENQVVPGSLADVLITFSVSGYHDSGLREAINGAEPQTTTVTSYLPARQIFPDAFYDFSRTGRMLWNVTDEVLAVTDMLGAVRNVGVLLPPANGRANHFGRVMSNCAIRVRIGSTGELQVLNEVPKVEFTRGGAADPLLLRAKVAEATSNDGISWDFGDGSARQSGAAQQHNYARPGRYTVGLRVVHERRLSEYQFEVVVSRSLADLMRPPVMAFPKLKKETGPDIPAGHTRVVGTANTAEDDPVTVTWRVGEQESQRGNTATFDLKPGDCTLFFTAVRKLQARIYATQRQYDGPAFEFSGLSLASNRRFNPEGNVINGVGENPPANDVAKHLLSDGALSPVDEWTLELPLAGNPFLRSVTATDVEQVDLSEIQDAVLALEYETTPGG